MDWGLKEVDKLGLEVHIESSTEGRHLYERSGLKVFLITQIDMSVDNPSDQWKEYQHRLGVVKEYQMWRPKHGIWVEGMTGPCDTASLYD